MILLCLIEIMVRNSNSLFQHDAFKLLNSRNFYSKNIRSCSLDNLFGAAIAISHSITAMLREAKSAFLSVPSHSNPESWGKE
jgi:hypothetical protein